MIQASIIIPTYKRPKETKLCLDLLFQSAGLGTIFDVEILLVDDSDLASRRQLKALLKKTRYPEKINYIEINQHLMIGEKRERAIARARAGLMIILDTDIEVQPKTVLQTITFFKDHPTVARATGTVIFKGGPHDGKVDRPTRWDRRYRHGGVQYLEGVYGRYEAYYKPAFQAVGGYDPIFGFRGEGTDLSVKFWRAGYPLAFIPGVRVLHNQHAGASAARNRSARMTEMYRSLFLVAYKYGIFDPEESKHFLESHSERQFFYGNATEFFSVVGAAQSVEWFAQHLRALQKSRASVPKRFDFKPFDVFTNTTLLKKCLSQARATVAPFHKKVFGK